MDKYTGSQNEGRQLTPMAALLMEKMRQSENPPSEKDDTI